MTLWVKVGTLSALIVHVVRKRKEPKSGDIFQIVEDGRRVRVICREIKEIGGRRLFYLERW